VLRFQDQWNAAKELGRDAITKFRPSLGRLVEGLENIRTIFDTNSLEIEKQFYCFNSGWSVFKNNVYKNITALEAHKNIRTF